MSDFKQISISLITASSLLTISCKETTKKYDLTPASENQKIEITDEGKMAILGFAKELEAAIKERNRIFLQQRINAGSIVEKAMEGLGLSSEQEMQFAKSIPGMKRDLSNALCASQTKFIKYIKGDSPSILYRIIDGKGTWMYWEFVVGNTDGKWEIVDIYKYVDGMLTSERLRSVLEIMFPKVDEVDPLLAESFQKCGRVIRLYNTGKVDEAWNEWKTINHKTYNNRFVLSQGHKVASRIYSLDVSNTEPLFFMLSLMDKHFSSDVGFALLKLPTYAYIEDSENIRKVVQKIRDRVGDDPYLELVESMADFYDGEYSVALEKATKYRDLEPHISGSYIHMLRFQAKLKDYKGLTKTLNEYMNRFDVVYSVLKDKWYLSQFFDSPEGKAWLEKYKK